MQGDQKKVAPIGKEDKKAPGDHLNEDKLKTGAAALMSVSDCGSFVSNAIQAAFLLEAGVTSANEPDAYSQGEYANLSAESVLDRMGTAMFVDASTASPAPTRPTKQPRRIGT